jgi:hypothetical protein
MVFGYKGVSFGWLKAKNTHYTGQIFYIVIAVFCPVTVILFEIIQYLRLLQFNAARFVPPMKFWLDIKQ